MVAQIKSTRRWHCETAKIAEEAVEVADRIVAAMTDAGYAENDIFAMRLAMEEAIVNGVKHGNRGDPTKKVRVRFQVTNKCVVAEVQDEGTGFDPNEVLDPLAAENLERSSGRGLLLMRTYLTWCRFTDSCAKK